MNALKRFGSFIMRHEGATLAVLGAALFVGGMLCEFVSKL